jgi:hypothetical protein
VAFVLTPSNPIIMPPVWCCGTPGRPGCRPRTRSKRCGDERFLRLNPPGSSCSRCSRQFAPHSPDSRRNHTVPGRPNECNRKRSL